MIKAKRGMSSGYVRSILRYDPDSGKLYWIKPPKHHGELLGKEAGTYGPEYVSVQIDGSIYRAHRLIWLIVYGRWPSQYIDHINRDGFDNRLCNLRECSQAENTRNHGKGINGSNLPLGVHRVRERFQARITYNGKCHSLGYFDNPTDAGLAYKSARTRMFGRFA